MWLCDQCVMIVVIVILRGGCCFHCCCCCCCCCDCGCLHTSTYPPLYQLTLSLTSSPLLSLPSHFLSYAAPATTMPTMGGMGQGHGQPPNMGAPGMSHMPPQYGGGGAGGAAGAVGGAGSQQPHKMQAAYQHQHAGQTAPTHGHPGTRGRGIGPTNKLTN